MNELEVKEAEFERMFQLLRKYGVLRDNMLGGDWFVIYTEQGPMDITLNRLKGISK